METGPKITLPLSVFISYAPVPKDETLRQELEAHLSPLKNLGFITTWHHRKTLAGKNRQQELSEHLETASLILLLMSADFLASEECCKEMQIALEREQSGEALVIPILLRKVHLESAPLTHLQCLPRDGRPVRSWKDPDEAFTTIIAEIRETIETCHAGQNKRISDKERRLHALIPDHNGFLNDRLASFVGRQHELADIQDIITQRLPIGGYITITGQAGQGKSSIIAKLVEHYGIERVAHHFIPINPGPDHQVGLLRNLMARLILKYALSDLYVASDNRAALRDYFPKVLTDVANQGGQEIICIDGLDQLEEDFNGVRDLSFLPTNPPAGIVFVLGTRPNDTMKPLELLKPHNEYRLPNLSRQDFDRLLQHRAVSLKETIADQFYTIMGENALYLDLVAKELNAFDAIDPLAIITCITANPNNIFTLSLERLKRQGPLWERVIYPILGVLLTAQEPLSLPCLREILQVEDYKLRDGIARLGGLLTEDTQRRHSLFHLKLRDYLHQDIEHPQKEYVFSTEEEEGWHARFALWCEHGHLSLIWQNAQKPAEQGRRTYARQHYITHLYYAHKWQQLFDVLDEGGYGHAKERYDVSTRSYIQDIDFGRRAAVWSNQTKEEALTSLPRLWQYTLLRCSLRSRADSYPSELFQLMLLLGREREALGYIELLTSPVQKSYMLQIVAVHLSTQPERQIECRQIFQRAEAVAQSVGSYDERMQALSSLAISRAEVEQSELPWKYAEEIVLSITETYSYLRAMRELVVALVQAERWIQALQVICSIPDDYLQVWMLEELTTSLAGIEQKEELASLWEKVEEIVHSITNNEAKARALGHLAAALVRAERWIQAEPLWKLAEDATYSIIESDTQSQALMELAATLTQAKRWEQAKEAACSITHSEQQSHALGTLATALAQAGKLDQAASLLKQVEDATYSITHRYRQAQSLGNLATTLAKVGRWEQAEEIARSIVEKHIQTLTLKDLAVIMLKAEKWEKAGEIARSIADNDRKLEALSALTVECLNVERWDQAISLLEQVEKAARSITNSYQQAQSLENLVTVLAKVERWEQAEEIARSIVKKHTQARALAELGISLVERKREYAESMYIKAKEVEHSITQSNKQATALRKLATALAHTERWEQAKEVALSIIQSDEQAIALRKLATALAHTGRWKQAEEVAFSITQNDQLSWTLSDLASVLEVSQQWAYAETLWRKAEEAVHSIPDRDKQVWALSDLASALEDSQRWEQAQSLWRQAEEIVHSIPDRDKQIWVLIDLATSLEDSQRSEGVESLWKQAEKVVHSMIVADEYGEDEVLMYLVEALTQSQRWEQAEKVAFFIADELVQSNLLSVLAVALAKAEQWEQAKRIKNSITDSYHLAEALSTLAMTLTQAKEWGQAESLWRQAEEAVRSVLDISEQNEALVKLTKTLAQAQCWEQAEKIARSISGGNQQSEALSTLAIALAQAQRWEQTEKVALSITDTDEQAKALSKLVGKLFTDGEHERAFTLVQHSWLHAETQASALQLFSSAVEGLISLKPDIGVALYQAFKWVNTFLIKVD